MKNGLIYLSILFVFIACSGKEDPIRKKFALAGVYDESMVYNDFVPDLIIKSDTLGVDINNDGLNDFCIGAYSESGYVDGFIFIQRDNKHSLEFNGERVSGSGTYDSLNYDSGMPYKLTYKDTIKHGYSWTTDFRGTGSNYKLEFNNNWLNKEQYLGIRFVENADTLYGWIRLNVKSEYEVVLYDCAYQK